MTEEAAITKRKRLRDPTVPRPPQHIAKVDTREPLRDPVHGEARRTRRRRSTANDDMFYIPVEEIPEGLSYEWKRYSVMGEEQPFYLAGLREQGWEPVDPKRHPNWVPPGYNQPSIIKHGLILMERPMELTEEARREARFAAKQQTRDAEERLGKTPAGELTRDHVGVKPQVVKEYVRPMVVEE
jgi:hypothetical protein